MYILHMEGQVFKASLRSSRHRPTAGSPIVIREYAACVKNPPVDYNFCPDTVLSPILAWPQKHENSASKPHLGMASKTPFSTP